MKYDFATKARRMTDAELHYALQDIHATLALYKDAPADHPYARKLWNEWDACLDEQHTRRRPSRKYRGHCAKRAMDDPC